MSIVDRVYILFLSIVREDVSGDRHKRAAIFLEMISTFFVGAIIMVLLGLFRIQLSSPFYWGMLMVSIGVLSYYLLNRYLIISERYLRLLEYVDRFSIAKKAIFSLISVIIVLLSFTVLIFGGVAMSYLLAR